MTPAQRCPTLARCLLIVCAVLMSCQPTAPTATPRPTPTVRPTVPTTAPTPTASRVPATTEVEDLPPEPGTVVTLDTGGSVFVPEGALPAGATIDAVVTQMPALPEDVSPVGDALSISASVGLLRPVTLRLPIPAGVTDPAQLAIVHIASDGALWFLMTRVEGSELVAEAPTFSTFARVRVPSGLSVELQGKARLLTGEQHTYLVKRSDPEAAVSTSWAALGGGTLVEQSDWAATLRAGEQEGHVDLICACSEQPSGRRWWGSKRVRVLHPGQDPNRFAVSVVARPNVATIGRDQVRIVAAVHGNHQAPITWTWEFENGVRGGPVTTDAGTTEFELPADSYPPQDQSGVHTVAVWARDFQERMFAGLGSYVLQAEPFVVAVKGKQYVVWNGAPGPVEAYTASASGGQPPYAYTFQLFPGADNPREGSGAGLNTGTFRFDQPGEYRLEVAAVDSRDLRVTTSLAIVAAGGEPLSTRFLTLPETALVDEKVTGFVSVRGGVLLTGAGKQGYLLKVDWNDGSAPVVKENVGATTMPYTGTIVSMVHTYAQPKKYTVRIEASDATGTIDSWEQDILITAAGTPTRAATATKAAPAATPTAGLLVWVRQEPAVVNVNKDQLEFVSTEQRWIGSSSKMTPAETSFITQERYVEHDVEFYNLTVTCSFERPPLVLNPGVRYKVKVSFSHGGTMNTGGGGVGERFWYSASRGYESIVEPREVLNYFPWGTVQGPSSKEWMITAPAAKKVGDTFQLYASLWNRPSCNVTWTYRAEYH